MHHLRIFVLVVCSWIQLSVSVEPSHNHRTSDPVLPDQGPVFTSEPPDEFIFANTRDVLVTCTAYGRPAPSLEWVDLNDQVIEDVPGVIRVLPNNSLHLLPFDGEDNHHEVHSAKLRCKASNSAGSIVSRIVQLRGVVVDNYVTYNIHGNDAYVMRGNTAVFRCNINPYFVREYVAVVTWTQSGRTIQSDERYSILPNGELNIRNVQTMDSYASYRCTTRNILTRETKISDPLTLYVIDPVSTSPAVESSVSELTVQQGQSVELPCVANAFPLASYEWSKDGLRISPNQSRVQLLGGNLKLTPASVADGGVYHCTAKNSLGEASARTKLVVTALLSVYIEPASQTIDVGDQAVFNCSVFGHPISEITWFKNGRPLMTSQRVTLLSNEVLLIRSVERQDKGMYQCIANGDDASAQGSAQLIIGAARPYIHNAFNEVYTRAGLSISISCTASGNPSPRVRWTLDDGPIPLDDRYTIGQATTPSGDVISFVNVSNIGVQDGGLYGCSAENSVGHAGHVGKINVYGVPYIRPMSNVTAVAGDILVLRCYVSGFPISLITWSHGGIMLPENHRQHVSSDGTLTIHNVDRQTDSGKYECDARNSLDQGMRRTAQVHVAEPPRVDAFQFPSRIEGDRVSVYCAVNSGDLPLNIDWLKDGQVIPSSLGVQTRKMGPYSSVMTIGLVEPKHDGNYTCLASNAFASDNHTASLHVDVPPYWVVEPQNATVRLGERATIHCLSSGDPLPVAVWKRAKGDGPGNYFDLDLTGSRSRQLANGTLVIENASAEDMGFYLCHAVNGIGSGISRVVFLTVRIPAKFIASTKNYTVQRGSNVTMECVAMGDRPLSLSWSFNGGSLSWQIGGRLGVPDYFTTTSGKGSRVTIQVAKREDSGFYMCNAKNLFGSDALVIRLLVLEPPVAIERLSVVEGGSRSVRLRWRKPFNGNSAIISYILQVKEKQDLWQTASRNITAPSNATEAKVGGLLPSFSYDVRVFAVNAIGTSEASEIVSYTADEEVPDGPPLNALAIGAGPKSLKVTWQAPAADSQNGQIRGYYIGYKVFNSSAPYMYITKKLSYTDEDSVPIEMYEYIIQHLEKFTKYSVHVQAFNAIGAGPRSPDMGVLTLEDVPSQPPQGLQASPLSSQSLMVVWSPPPLYALHGILQGYRVIYKPVTEDEDESDEHWLETSKLTAVLYGLEKYTNYCVQVLAFTRMGLGVRSPAIFSRTQQDIPERPADIKACPAGPDSILVSWRPPLHTNGERVKYTLFIRDITNADTEQGVVELSPNQHSFLVENLKENFKYGFRVSSSTVMGEGEKTREVSSSTHDQVSAQIASFSHLVQTGWHATVALACQAVGQPLPTLTWRRGGQPIVFDDRIKMDSNGTLIIANALTTDAANYTCKAENYHGADEIVISLLVQAPPKNPVLGVSMTTSSSIQVNWRSSSNGGSKIQGFYVNYKRAPEPQWRVTRLDSSHRSLFVDELLCGVPYDFRVQAFNGVGRSPFSNTITAKTNGSAPIMPAQSLILRHINSTFVVLDLSQWQHGGCALLWFSIEYQLWGDHEHWHSVRHHIPANTTLFRVDLQPESWYLVKVTAFNEAGSTECLLKFATKGYTGSTIEPMQVVHRYSEPFYQKAYIMIPLCALIVVAIVTAVAVTLFCRRRQQNFKYIADNATNLRRDLTAETSLMSDIDKHNMQIAQSKINSCIYSPDPCNTRNINTYSEAGLMPDDGILPYATFPKRQTQVKPLNCDPHSLHASVCGLTDLKDLPAPPPEMLSPLHEGVVLRCDLRAAHLAPSHLQSAFLPLRHSFCLRALSETGGQRASVVSTVSSTHDELAMALENAPTPAHDYDPTYEASAGVSYDPCPREASDDLRDFTQSPARPNEARRATCEVAIYSPASSRDASVSSSFQSSFLQPPLPPPPPKKENFLQQLSKKLSSLRSKESDNEKPQRRLHTPHPTAHTGPEMSPLVVNPNQPFNSALSPELIERYYSRAAAVDPDSETDESTPPKEKYTDV